MKNGREKNRAIKGEGRRLKKGRKGDRRKNDRKSGERRRREEIKRKGRTRES